MKANVLHAGDSLSPLVRIHMEKLSPFSRQISGAETVHLQGVAGTFWITMEGDMKDYVLRSGDRLHFHGPGKLVVESLEPSSLFVLLANLER